MIQHLIEARCDICGKATRYPKSNYSYLRRLLKAAGWIMSNNKIVCSEKCLNELKKQKDGK